MGTGVHAVVLAAASAALPFTPPAGFVQLPATAVNVQVTNVWSSPPKAGKPASAFSTMTVPFAAFGAAVSSAMKPHTQHGPVRVLSNVPVHVCGVSARLVTMQTGTGAAAQTIQQEMLEKNGHGYMLVYTRPSGAPADKHIGATMTAFCPTAQNAIPSLTPPPGWIVRPTMQTLGMWMGTQPGEIMTLMRVSQEIPLAKLAANLQFPGKAAGTMKKFMQIVSEKNSQLCGNPAAFVTIKFKMPEFPMTMEQVVTQAHGVSYLLNYMHPASVTPSPATEESLHSLCAAPSTTPATAPTVAPSASPTPTPGPVGTPRPAKDLTR